MAAYGLSENIHARIAEELYNAEKTVHPVALPTKQYPVITLADAYAVQKAGLSLRLADGEVVVGHKIGITSKGMMDMLECNSPDYGYLLASKEIPEGGSCTRSEMNSPIIEAELAFIIGEDLRDAPVTEDAIAQATTAVFPCFEICDSRFEDWKLTVRDTICDNAATGRYMLSSARKPLAEIDPASICMTMEKNGTVFGSASGSEVMGSPINSVTWLANKLLEYKECLHKGDVILSGAFMAADAAEAGDTYTVTFEGFPPLVCSFI